MMPELPEVETVRRSLEPHILGRMIRGVEVRPSLLSNAVKSGMLVLCYPGPEEFTARLRGQRFEKLERHGKQLSFRLPDQCLQIHLGMTGQLTFCDPSCGLGSKFDQHTHISFEFCDGTHMHYRDVRKFGKFRLFPADHPQLLTELARLGPDPLTPSFTGADFAQALRRTQRAVKAVLLDQAVVAGVGNIYADEALHLAGILPSTPAHQLGATRVSALFGAVREVLELALRHGGTTFSNYMDGEGRPGTNQEQLRAYGREGLPCLHCGTAMRRIMLAQRSTTYCPDCQR